MKRIVIVITIVILLFFLGRLGSKLSSKYPPEGKDDVTGDSNTGKVVIEGIVINEGVLRSIQGQVANCFDPQGNETITYQLTVGADKRLDQLNREIPVKFSVTFNSIPKAPLLSALSLKYYSRVDIRSNDLTVMFRNISIDWN